MAKSAELLALRNSAPAGGEMQNDFLADTVPVCCPGRIKLFASINRIAGVFPE